MNAKSNGNTSIAKMILIGVVAAGIGFVAGKFLFRSLFFVAVNKGGAVVAKPARKTALITLKADNGTCSFTDGNNVSYKYPVLKKNNGFPGTGDRIIWLVQDGRTNHSGSLKFDLQFPAGGSPFVSDHFDNDHNDSGETNADIGDYPYATVTIHPSGSPNINCLNAGDPGIHVDQ
jgi:hypothetical protein